MPLDDLQKDPNFDESAKRGGKLALQRLTVWYDLKHYRRFTKAIVGWSQPVYIHSMFQVAIGAGQAVLADPMPITKKVYEEELTRCIKEKTFAMVKHADKNPFVNNYENELILAFGQQAKFYPNGAPIWNKVNVPQSVQDKFEFRKPGSGNL